MKKESKGEKNKFYEPITEAFGYTENDLQNTFFGEHYELDTSGLEHRNEGELGTFKSYEEKVLADDTDLAAAYGYAAHIEENENMIDDKTLAAEFGYEDQGSESDSLNSQEIAAQFGYDDNVEAADG